jgi:hypothetical protein
MMKIQAQTLAATATEVNPNLSVTHLLGYSKEELLKEPTLIKKLWSTNN